MRLKIIQDDITELHVDCIVNAAKSSLLGGGGVDGAIHQKAGIELKEFCRSLKGCSVGEAKLSPAFNLKSKFIIHTVGPRFLFKTEKEKKQLAECYESSLKIASQNKFETLAFSNISTGAYAFPKDLAAEISISIIKQFFVSNEFPKKVIICCFDDENYSFNTKIINQYF